jgi:cyclopropane-fatty-acyl-phospholipid synthase
MDQANALSSPSRVTRSLARRLLHGQLARLQEGEIVLSDEWGTNRYGASGGLHADVQVHDPAFYADVLFGGTVGAGESYIAGRWSSADLTALVRILLRNRSVMDTMDSGWPSTAVALVRRVGHAARRNTRAGSRANIAAHYDVSNDFFRLFLDETMMYSCALFERPDMTLAEASTAKNERICRSLGLNAGHHLVEIGTGWGGFAIHAASRYGCRVTTTTISRAQHELAVERVRAAGLSERIEVLLADYRDLKGSDLQGGYDRLVSIEMIEAVGHQYYDAYFAKCASLLAPGGQALIQAITIDPAQYERARDEVDFIKRYVFPGSCIPCLPVLAGAAGRAGLRLAKLAEIGPHYARTLREWRRRLAARADEARALGFSADVLRLWEFYFSYCEGGFAEGALGTAQLVFERRE